MLTYALTAAFILLLVVYYLVLKQKSLIRTLLKYRDLNVVTLIEVVGSEVTAHLPRHKLSNQDGTFQSHHTPSSLSSSMEEKKVKPLKDVFQIPGPAILPVLGTRWQYYYRYNLPKLHEAYSDLHKRYGDIVLEVANGHPYLHLFNRNDIDKIMRTSSKYPFRPSLDIVVEYRKTRPDRYASFGLVQEQGKVWHSLRSNLTPGLSSVKVLNNFLPKLEETCDEFVEQIRQRRDAHGVIKNFRGVVNLFGLESIAELILDTKLGLLGPNPSMEILELANAVQQTFIVFRDVFYGSSLWKYLPSSLWRRYVKCEELIYSKISDIVDKSMAENNNRSGSKEDSYVDNDSPASIQEQILSSDLDIRDKKSGIIDLLSSGVEVLSGTLSVLLYHLSKNPESQQRILEELRDGFDSENLLEATYTKACIQEGFRMNPVGFVIARLQEEDIELSGYQVKGGTLVMCHTMITSQQEKNFTEARRFVPDRWIPQSTFWDQSPKPNHAASLVCPFGSGRRMCPGKRFSQMQILMLVSKIVQNFEIEYLGELDLYCDFILAPRDVSVRFKDRTTV